jgi:hypothetical protein
VIDINKQYRTRDGREVRIYATDGGDLFEDRTIHGAVLSRNNWVFAVWNAMNGKCYASAKEESGIDLIEVRPRHKRTVWLTVWSFNYIQVMSTPEWQISKSGRSGEIPYACIKVELDYEEGEGL